MSGEDEIARRLAEFAATYAHLPLYSRIAAAAGSDREVVALLTAAAPGQARPVLLLAALHDLVLRTPSVPAARWFAAAPAIDRVGGDPWPDVRETLLSHAAELRSVIATRTTQTNEVNRAVYVAALLAAACADLPSSPVALVEQGASAGLLLGLDRYRVAVGDVVLGDPVSPVSCSGSLASGSVAGPLPTIVERVGVDRSPVALGDADEVRWLEACLWPDQPERLERFRAAVALLRDDPPLVVAGDMVDDLASVAHSARAIATATATNPAPASPPSDPSPRRGPASPADPSAPVHLVVLSSWALTYVRRDRRPAVAEALGDLAADGRPVTWATAEPPGCVPGLPDVPPSPLADRTVLALRRWRAGTELAPEVIGTSHPHATTLHLP